MTQDKRYFGSITTVNTAYESVLIKFNEQGNIIRAKHVQIYDQNLAGFLADDTLFTVNGYYIWAGNMKGYKTKLREASFEYSGTAQNDVFVMKYKFDTDLNQQCVYDAEIN